MKKDLVFMVASGVPLQRISEIVQSTNYQGFPVVRSYEDRTIIGFVRKTELRYALGELPHSFDGLPADGQIEQCERDIYHQTRHVLSSAYRQTRMFLVDWWIIPILSFLPSQVDNRVSLDHQISIQAISRRLGRLI